MAIFAGDCVIAAALGFGFDAPTAALTGLAYGLALWLLVGYFGTAAFGKVLTDLIGETDLADGLAGTTVAVFGRAVRVWDLKLVFKAAGVLV